MVDAGSERGQIEQELPAVASEQARSPGDAESAGLRTRLNTISDQTAEQAPGELADGPIEVLEQPGSATVERSAAIDDATLQQHERDGDLPQERPGAEASRAVTTAARVVMSHRVADMAMQEQGGLSGKRDPGAADGTATPSSGEAGAVVEDAADNAFAQSEFVVAQLAHREAGRLQAILDDPESGIGSEERASAQRTIERLRLTSGIHEANLPLETADRLDEAGGADRSSDVSLVVVPDLPFTNVPEQVDRRTDDDLIQEIENKDNLVRQADKVGEPIRLAAMNLSPIDMRGRRETMHGTATDEELPNSVWRVDATFEKEGGDPVLRTVTSRYIADRSAEQDKRAQAARFGENAITHPLTVTATFDGPRLTEVRLNWPNRSRMPVTEAQLGPAWKDVVSENGDGLLAKLVREVESTRRVSGPNGFVSVAFGDQPTVSSGIEATVWRAYGSEYSIVSRAVRMVEAVNPVWHLFKSRDMKFPPRQLSSYQYSPVEDNFIGEDGEGRLGSFSASEVMRLAEDIRHFFPVMA